MPYFLVPCARKRIWPDIAHNAGMSTTVKEYFKGRLESVRDSYVKDLEALKDEQMGASFAGAARIPYDFTYEVTFINHRIAKRLRGEDPGPFQQDGWMKAPAEACHKQTCIERYKASMDDLISAFEQVPDGEMLKVITLPSGETSPMDLAYFMSMHNTYHDAQLNYIQALHGDDQMHWTD
jgi:hypothetical protein